MVGIKLKTVTEQIRDLANRLQKIASQIENNESFPNESELRYIEQQSISITSRIRELQ